MRSFALLLWVPLTAVATPAGISGFSGKSAGTTCTSCHSGGAAPTVTVNGPTTLMLGATGMYTVTVSGGPGKNAGIDAALGGAAAVFTAGTGTKLLNGEVVQNAAATMTGGTATFAFSVRAPAAAGVFTLSVAGLSGDANLSPSGDGVGTATVNVTVGTPGTGTDAGTPAVVDAGTPPPPAAVEAGAPKPATTTNSRDYVAGPVGPGGVEGDVGCSSVGGAPMLILAAMLLMAWLLRRRAEPLRIRSRRANRKP